MTNAPSAIKQSDPERSNQKYLYWFVAFVNLFNCSKWITGLILAAALAPVFLWLFNAFSPELYPNREQHLTGIGTSLFFAFINAYAITAGAYVVERSQAIMDELRTAISLDDETFAAQRESLSTTSLSTAIWLSMISLATGIAHTMLLQGTVTEVFSAVMGSKIAFGGMLGTFMAWFIVTPVVTAFVRNANTFARIGALHIDIDLLHKNALTPFGTSAILPTLGLIGTQMLYPLLSLAGGFNPYAVLPGFVITLLASIYLFIRTSWPLHRRLSNAKVEAIAQINDQISDWQKQANEPEMPSSLSQLQPLLNFRQYLEGLSEWPFSQSAVARWAFYLIIPPITWVCAALMENVIDNALG